MADIKSVLSPEQLYYPSQSFKQKAYLKSEEEYEALYHESIKNPESFWEKQAKECLTWQAPWEKVCERKGIKASWFIGGKINASYNCIDRHLPKLANKKAIIWEGEDRLKRSLSYFELSNEVCKLAGALTKQGLKAEDCVTIYMPLVPELVIAMLACARLGVMHNVVFAGFSANALAERIKDSKSKLIISANGSYRKGKWISYKDTVDQARDLSNPKLKCIVFYNREIECNIKPKIDLIWHECSKDEPANFISKELDAENPLFCLYTSGSTGKPKGLVHSTAGYLLAAHLSFKYVFDHKENDIFWCTADIGWITGHSYIVYGPLSNGATVLMYEGAPDTPDWGRFWQLIETYKVSIFYTAPTAIRSLQKQGASWPEKYDLSSLRLLGSVGEPISPETWKWFYETIGKKNCPLVDTWWQTETGSIMLSAIPGAIPCKPGSAAKPFFGVDIDIVDKMGTSLGKNQGGYLVIRSPWPSMARTILGDPERYKTQYLDPIEGMYFTGDGARKDEDGYYWVMGRIDDVINVSGHRLSTMEMEAITVSHPWINEAAVIGCHDPIKGEAIVIFAIATKDNLKEKEQEQLRHELSELMVKQIGALARPRDVYFLQSLPKTRSGKIMRRILKAKASGQEITQDTSTIENSEFLRENFVQ